MFGVTSWENNVSSTFIRIISIQSMYIKGTKLVALLIKLATSNVERSDSLGKVRQFS